MNTQNRSPSPLFAFPALPGSRLRPVDETQLKFAVVSFAVMRTILPPVANSTLDNFSVLPFPAFGIDPGLVTSHGAAVEDDPGGTTVCAHPEGLLTGKRHGRCPPCLSGQRGHAGDTKTHRAGHSRRACCGGQCQLYLDPAAATRCSIRWARASRCSHRRMAVAAVTGRWAAILKSLALATLRS